MVRWILWILPLTKAYFSLGFSRTPCDDVDSPELNKSLAERLLEKQRKAVKMCSWANNYHNKLDFVIVLENELWEQQQDHDY